MSKKFTAEVGNFKQDTKRINDLYEAINKILAHHELRKLDEGGNPIAELRDKLPKDSEVWIQFRDLIKYSRNLQKSIDTAFDVSKFDHMESLEREAQNKLQERKHLWMLWVEKYIRWVLGLFVAIFLYSCLTCFTDGSKFWKIPVKETIEKFAPKL